MAAELQVYLDWQGATVRLGTLWLRTAGRASASFAYDPSWLARRDRFGVDPELPIGAGQFHTNRPIFNAFADAAPDRWGQNLLRRQERQRAKAAGGPPRTLFAGDLLLGVDDVGRHGAFRFKTEESEAFLADTQRPIPPLLALAKLQAAAARFVRDRETESDLALLLGPGTSLGGARPKASVLDRDGSLWLAKFSRVDDDWPVIAWEATALALAARAGIVVAQSRLHVADKRMMLLLRRFDRLAFDAREPAASRRVAFCSAFTALAATDGEQRSYLELLDFLRRDGAAPARDAAELWRRMLFNVLISNTDDHLRNHGFLRTPAGWHLAPAYDLNPVPVDVRPRVHALALDADDATASLDTLLSVAPRFGLKQPLVQQIVREVVTALADWPATAAASGLNRRAVERMASAFEHDDATAAQRLVGGFGG